MEKNLNFGKYLYVYLFTLFAVWIFTGSLWILGLVWYSFLFMNNVIEEFGGYCIESVHHFVLYEHVNIIDISSVWPWGEF
jgi:hypothetical protein